MYQYNKNKLRGKLTANVLHIPYSMRGTLTAVYHHHPTEYL